jgi:hypothetical protein
VFALKVKQLRVLTSVFASNDPQTSIDDESMRILSIDSNLIKLIYVTRKDLGIKLESVRFEVQFIGTGTKFGAVSLSGRRSSHLTDSGRMTRNRL